MGPGGGKKEKRMWLSFPGFHGWRRFSCPCTGWSAQIRIVFPSREERCIFATDHSIFKSRIRNRTQWWQSRQGQPLLYARSTTDPGTRELTLGLWNCEGLRRKLSTLTHADLKLYDASVFVEIWGTHPNLDILQFHVAQSMAKKCEGPERPSAHMGGLIAT